MTTEAEARQKIIEAIVATIEDEDGAGSDLDYSEPYDPRSGYMEVVGNLDVSQLADVVRIAMQPALAAAWQEGRESIALDLAKPLPYGMLREATPNPYA